MARYGRQSVYELLGRRMSLIEQAIFYHALGYLIGKETPDPITGKNPENE